MDLRERYKVTKVLTQGRQDYAQWVTQFKVSYSVDGTNFIFQNKVSANEVEAAGFVFQRRHGRFTIYAFGILV